MPIDRQDSLKKAEKLVRQGKLDGAIQEYVRLVKDQPEDWNSVSALGDLYVKAGNNEGAVAQFRAMADHLYANGFLPKAAAIYKRVLKLDGDHEHALMRLAEAATQQSLVTEAKTYLRHALKLRRDRRDERAVAECHVLLGGFDDADAGAKIVAARAARSLGDRSRACTLFRDAADLLRDQDRLTEALDARVEAAIDSDDAVYRARVARECMVAGLGARMRSFLTLEAAGDATDLLLELARIKLAAGQDAEARSVFVHLMTVAPGSSGAVMAAARELAAAGRLESAFGCVDVVADAALLAGSVDAAVTALESFTLFKRHIPALVKLVDIAADAGRDELLRETQAQLADAYLDAGLAAEALAIAKELVAYDPGSEAHQQRLRRARDLSGPADEQSAKDRETATVAAGRADTPAMPTEADAITIDPADIELGKTLAEAPPDNLESVFGEMRARVAREQQVTEAEQQYVRAVQNLQDGRIADAIVDLQAAARAPMFRFQAASRLGRVYISQGDLETGINWLERAAEAPPPAPEQGRELLYELADTLDRIGESARALAVLMEIAAQGGGFRDVEARIEQLSRQAGSGNR